MSKTTARFHPGPHDIVSDADINGQKTQKTKMPAQDFLDANDFYGLPREASSHDNVLFLLNWLRDKEASLSVSKRIFKLDFNNVIVIPSHSFSRNDVYIPFI